MDSERRRQRPEDRDGHERHYKKARRGDSPSRGGKIITPIALPFNAKPMSKHDLRRHRMLFAYYLDIQKQLQIDDLEAHELKGRWKSFVGKWNRGELSEGYYDPLTRSKAESGRFMKARSPETSNRTSSKQNLDDAGNEEIYEDFGPALPPAKGLGAAIPSRQDLQYRDELVEEARDSARAAVRHERQTERKLQRDRLDDLAPRAEAGTKERQLEKKREKSAANRSFRDGKDGGTEDVRDSDLMGEDGIEGYKSRLVEQDRRKTEREIRKEEALRARAAEREERMSAHRAKEAKTMDMLKELAKQRFG